MLSWLKCRLSWFESCCFMFGLVLIRHSHRRTPLPLLTSPSKRSRNNGCIQRSGYTLQRHCQYFTSTTRSGTGLWAAEDTRCRYRHYLEMYQIRTRSTPKIPSKTEMEWLSSVSPVKGKGFRAVCDGRKSEKSFMITGQPTGFNTQLHQGSFLWMDTDILNLSDTFQVKK